MITSADVPQTLARGRKRGRDRSGEDTPLPKRTRVDAEAAKRRADLEAAWKRAEAEAAKRRAESEAARKRKEAERAILERLDECCSVKVADVFRAVMRSLPDLPDYLGRLIARFAGPGGEVNMPIWVAGLAEVHEGAHPGLAQNLQFLTKPIAEITIAADGEETVKERGLPTLSCFNACLCDAGVKVLCEELACLPPGGKAQVGALNLQWNQITDTGLTHLCRFLEGGVAPGLIMLNLGNNHIGKAMYLNPEEHRLGGRPRLITSTEGVETLVECLRSGAVPEVVRIKLHHNHIPYDGFAELVWGLKWADFAPKLSELNLAQNNIENVEPFGPLDRRGVELAKIGFTKEVEYHRKHLQLIL